MVTQLMCIVHGDDQCKTSLQSPPEVMVVWEQHLFSIPTIMKWNLVQTGLKIRAHDTS